MRLISDAEDEGENAVGVHSERSMTIDEFTNRVGGTVQRGLGVRDDEVTAYDIVEHRHRFSVWAAARAAQRGFTTIAILRDALEQSGVVAFVAIEANTATDAPTFDHVHRDWCRSIMQHLESKGVKNVTFGRAAKLIAVYLKSVVVLAGKEGTSLAREAHPPIDAILLRNLCKATARKPSWQSVRWTQLDEQTYYALIDELRTCVAKGEPFWKLEQHWTVSDDQE